MDLATNDPETEAPWDFSDGKVRTKAMNFVKEGQPFMIICSRMCTAFFALQALNVERRDPIIVRRELECQGPRAVDHEAMLAPSPRESVLLV